MKKAHLVLSFIAIIWMTVSCRNSKNGSANAAELSAGTLTFSIEPPKEVLKDAGMMAGALPKEATMYFDGDKSAIEVSLMGMMVMRLITNGTARTETILVSGMGGKEASIGTENDIKPMLDSLRLITEETTETKEILGMTATKFIVRDTVKHTESAVFVAKDAPVGNLYWCLPIGNIKGLILAYEYTMNGAKFQLTATKIDVKKPEPTEFEIPEGYEKKDWNKMSLK
jgi:hypothetical protein